MSIISIREVLERAKRRDLIRHAKEGALPISADQTDEEAEHLASPVADLNDELARAG